MLKKVIIVLTVSMFITACSGYNVNVNDKHLGTIQSN